MRKTQKSTSDLLMLTPPHMCGHNTKTIKTVFCKLLHLLIIQAAWKSGNTGFIDYLIIYIHNVYLQVCIYSVKRKGILCFLLSGECVSLFSPSQPLFSSVFTQKLRAKILLSLSLSLQHPSLTPLPH